MFSWDKAKKRAIKNEINRSKILAKKGDAEFMLKHTDEVREATQGNYIKLESRIKKEHADNDLKVSRREKKIGNLR